MSADGQGDTGNLIKDEKSPTTTHSEGISVTSTVDVNVDRGQTNTDQNTVLTTASKAEIPINDDKDGNDEEIENIIEKKLPIDKDKGLDIDSELDFELKWDDDTDLNEDLLDTDKEIESTLTSVDEGIDSVSKNAETVSTSIEKDLDSEKDTESILTSIDEGLDSVTKDLETTTSTNVNLDDEEKATESILTSIDEALESVSKHPETTLMSIDKVIDNADEMQSTLTTTKKGLSSVGPDKETTIASTEKELGSADPETKVGMPSVEKDNNLDELDCEMDHNVDKNTAPDTNVMDIDEVAEETQSKPVNVLVHSYELKRTNISENEGETLNVVTSKIDFVTKSSPNESEANSLDEQLVYSDVEVPDIEDKDLMDEIDAQITETNKCIDELKIKDTEKIQALPLPSTGQEEYKESETSQKDLDEIDAQITETENNIDEIEIKDAEKIQAFPEPSTSQEDCKKNETPQKDLLSEFDVDSNLINSTQVTEKSDLSDTCASITDMETSSYEINSEHGLDKADVMLDIPTQELIESFDDSGETTETAVKSKDKLEEYENVINKPVLIGSTTSEEDNKIMTESQATVDKTNLVQSDKNDDSNSASDIFLKDKVESAVEREKSTDDIAKIESMDVDTSSISEEAIKPSEENSEGNTNIETIKSIQENVSAIEKFSPTDFILEKPNQENLAPTEEKPSEGDIILEANSEQLKLDTDKTSPTEETEVNKEIKEKSFAKQDLKDVESKSNDIHVAQPSISKDHQELSDEERDASKSKDIDVAPSTSKDNQEMSDEDHKRSKSKDIDAAQPSTSKAHQELSNEDQEVSKSEDIDVAHPSTSKDHQELSDEDHKRSKSKDIDAAQPSSSKDHQELSDEDQEASKSKDIDVAQPSTSKDHQELSDEDQEASKSKDIDATQPSTSMNHQELSDEDQEALKSKDIDVAQPSTSKDHQELSDEDQEASKSEDINVAQPSTSKHHQELSDEDQEVSKSKDIDVAHPSTSKDHQELSDEDQEASKSKVFDAAHPSTSKDHQELSDEDQEVSKSKDIDAAQPSTSKDHQELSDEDQEASKSKNIDATQPSTSKDHQELSDEDQEATDSLGLLAESSRVMDDEDEQEQEQEAEDDDDDDDFDQDDESNQMTAEHSEDSNAQHSESDVPKESMDVDESNDAVEPIDEAAEIQDMETETDDPEVYDVDSHLDETSADQGDFQIQIGGVVSGIPEVETEAEESVEVSAETPESIEAQKAVETLLEDKPTEEEKSSDVLEPAASVEEAAKPPEDADFTAIQNSRLRALLLKDSSDSSNDTSEAEQKSPARTKNLEISKQKHEINIVELEESSSEDDVQVYKPDQPEPTPTPKEQTPSAAEESSLQKQVARDVPKPASKKTAKLDTEKTKTASLDTESTAISETTAPKTPEAKTPIDLGEIFSLDSDDEDTEDKNKRKKKLTAAEIDKAGDTNKCINVLCTSDVSVPLVPASISASVYYAANSQRGSGLCLNCAQRFEDRSKKLIEGVKDLTPYLNMDMCMVREELVEISDSDSDDDALVKKDDEILGEKGVKFLEEQLADMFNDTWKKYDMEARLLAAQTEISREIRQLEDDCKKIDAILHDCQTDTDKLRNDLYGTFADDRRILPSIAIFDTPTKQWSGLEEALPPPVENKEPPRLAKRRLPAPAEPTAKRPAIPLGYAPLDANKEPQEPKPVQPPAEVPLPPEDDNADISVVKLSVESAPAGLPPLGVATRPPLRPNMMVYAMRNSFGAWHKVKIVEVLPKIAGQFTSCRVRFEHPKNTSKVLPARCLAYEHAPDVRLTIGTRVVALFKDHRNLEVLEKKEAYYSGIVAEIPNPVNNFRYLIFFDDGYAQYVQHAVTRLVCECAPRVWDEVHPFSRQFVRDYLRAYPERPMVRLHAGQNIKTEWNGRWWPSKVIQVDASLVHVHFDGKKEAGIDKTEWIYRGSTRLAPLFLELQAAERQRSRPLPRAQAGRRFNMPYVEYTRQDESIDSGKPAPPLKTLTPAQNLAQTQAQIEQEIRRQRAVAKKSTAVAPPPQPVRENVTSRVVYYSPKNAIKPHKWVHHTCGPQCKRKDVLALKDLRTYNPLTKPLLSGWERHTLRFRAPQSKTAMYRAPCGRRIRNHRELHQYLQAIESDMSVDLFDFSAHTHCLAEFVLNKCIVSKKDLSHGKENVPVPCVNYYDDSLPEFCSYNTERTPTAGVPLNLDPEFLCGCDCTDDCADKTKCACWKMTLEGARTIGLDTDEVGYVYKRLPEPLPSGIYECNSRCKCRQTCLNRVAQHPLQLKLQVFKTANRGWGIRALNDVPKGAFLCVYAGNLLTDATANLDGLNEGDEYLAELDYIEVVEQMKEGFEEDIPDDAKKLDQDSSSSSSSLSSDEEPARDADDDFRPALPTGHYRGNEYSKRLRKREKSKKENEEREKKAKEDKEKNSEDCITISDDEELREPARFAARSGMGGKEFVSKYKSVRAHFGKDEACYIMDAKVQGNIGRYLNHSCTPNVFVQNVFVDTHDPRFPWVAFFALSHIKAGTELTWNYNYDVGSVPGKVLYCYCNAPNCRGRLL